MVDTCMGTDGHVSKYCRVNLDSIFHYTYNVIETINTQYNADKYSSFDKVKSGDISSTRYDSKEMSE